MDLSQVTLTQMRYAVAVADAGSFRLAAERSHVSQPGLSMQIQKLEGLLDTVLFDRSKKPVLVTPEGEAALTQMRAVLRETERLGQVVVAHGEPSGPYRLGVIPTLSASVIPLFLPAFVARFPDVELTVEEIETEPMIDRLRADTLDAGLAATPLEAPGLAETQLGLERLFAYLPPDDPLLAKRRVTQADLEGRPLWIMPEGHCFRSQVLRYCESRSSREQPPVHFESGSFETLVRLVDAGLGGTLLPALVVQRLDPAKRDAQVRPLVSPVPVREIGLVTARDDLRRSVNEPLVALIRESLAEALGRSPRRPLVLDPL